MTVKNIESLWVVLSLLFVLSGLISCEKDGISADDYQIQFRREAQLENAYINGIAPLNVAFVAGSRSLRDAVNLFTDAPTVSSLETVQLQWISMLETWKQLELYNVGPIENSFIHFEINRWPTDIEIVEEYISGTAALNTGFINSIGSSSKGISALEYLFFSRVDNDVVLENFTNALDQDRRKQYANSLADNLANKAIELEVLWLEYQTDFMNATQNGISGSQNQLTNALVALIEEIVISKLGNALGDSSGGGIDEEALEALRSGASLRIIEQHLKALRASYTGNYLENSIRWGFNDYLDLIDREILSDEIIQSFSNCQEKIDVIPGSLQNALTTNPQSAEDLREAFNELLIYIKVDMANAIGTTITINDNDGD